MGDGKDAQEQLKRFQATARALGCDEDEAAFDEKLKAIARQKPKDEPNQEPRLTRKRAAKPVAS